MIYSLKFNLHILKDFDLDNIFLGTWSSYKIFATFFCFFLIYTFIVPHSVAFNSLNTSVWTVGSKMPTPRTEHLAASYGDKIYVIGGRDYSKNLHIDKLEIYDTREDLWRTDPKPIPQPVDHGAAAEYDGKIYVAGGFTKGKVPTDKLFIYDIEKDQWEEGTPLISPRGAMTAEFINGMLYVVGGLNSSQVPVNILEAYDPNADIWISKNPMPTARHHLESTVVDGKLFALGGRILGDGVPSEDMHESLTNFNRNEMYDPKTDTWVVKQKMLNKRSGFAADSFKEQIYVFGGEGVNETLDSVEKYDPITDKWTLQAPMPSKRMGLEAVTVDNKIFTIGGQIIVPKLGLVALDSNEIFSPTAIFNGNWTN